MLCCSFASLIFINIHTFPIRFRSGVWNIYRIYIGYICADTNTVETEWSENIEINDRTVRFQLDTGAKCNVLPLTTFKELGLNCDQLALSKTNLKSYSGHRVKPVGNIILQCKYQDHVSYNSFEVVDLPSEPILGSASCSAMGLVKRTWLQI